VTGAMLGMGPVADGLPSDAPSASELGKAAAAAAKGPRSSRPS
jgi:hypothetical protein